MTDGSLQSPEGAGVTRRVSLCAAASTAALSLPAASQAQQHAAARPASGGAPRLHSIELDIKGESYLLSADPRTTLLDAPCERLGLSGTKQGCGHGQCGACPVHQDGARLLQHPRSH